MQGTSKLILAEEKKNLINNSNDTSNHIIHLDFTLETLNQENQHSFECSSLLLSYSFIIKGYMSNLGPHLRHNRHCIFLHKKEQPCSQFVLHMHDQKPMIYTYNNIFYVSLYDLTTCLFIGFTKGKTVKIGSQKWPSYKLIP
jgi:hypothetical protein